jgi:hypothetical protein
MTLEETERLIVRWDRLRGRTRDAYKRRLAGRILRTLARRRADLLDRPGPATTADRPGGGKT